MAGGASSPVPGTQNQTTNLGNSPYGGGPAFGGAMGGLGMPMGGQMAPGGQAGKPSAPGGQTMPMQGGQLRQNFPTQQGQFLNQMQQQMQPMGGQQMLQPGQTAPPVNLNSMNLGSLFNDLQAAAPSAAGLASIAPHTGLSHYGPQGGGPMSNR